MNAAQFLACVMEVNAPTRLVATSAPVHEATSPAQMAPDVLISVWAPVSLLLLMAAVLQSRPASSPRCSAAVTQDAAGLWDKSLRCAPSGDQTSSGACAS